MKKKHKLWVTRITWLIFILYLIALMYFLFYYGRTTSQEYSFNLHLFKEIRRFITYRQTIGMKSFMLNMFGNVFAFAPFGFFLPIISPKNEKFFHVALLSLEFTLTIEILQYLLKLGIFDVDDIFLNTLGGVIGYILYLICRTLMIKKKKHS